MLKQEARKNELELNTKHAGSRTNRKSSAEKRAQYKQLNFSINDMQSDRGAPSVRTSKSVKATLYRQRLESSYTNN